MAVNITNITAIDSIHDMGLYASRASGGLFWGLILVALFIIIMTRLNHIGPANASVSASIACLFLSLLFFNMGFVDLLYTVFFGIALAGSLMYIAFKSG